MSDHKTALITGIAGQDGRLMAELLMEIGYRVVGTSRDPNHAAGTLNNPALEIVPFDLRDADRLAAIIRECKPDEIYNFSAYSSGAGMWDDPVGIGDINGLAVARILEGIRAVNPNIRFCQASSSELFGEPVQTPQNEATPFNPRSPYGVAKLYAQSMISLYRERLDLFACSAILFNHESPYRGEGFVTRKITQAAARIKLGLGDSVTLGNLEARRDWGYAGDYVRAMWLMLQAERPADYVLATGETHSVAELCDIAFGHLDLDYRDFVRSDPAAYRAGEALQLVGDAAKATRQLGWSPRVGFRELIEMMVDCDVRRLAPHDQNGVVNV
jgi:GDPmannose 4,6-dehydratase